MLLTKISHAVLSIRSVAQIWVVKRHQCRISAPVSQSRHFAVKPVVESWNFGCLLCRLANMAFHFRQNSMLHFTFLFTIHPTFCVCHLSLHSRFNFLHSTFYFDLCNIQVFALDIQLFHKQATVKFLNSTFKFSGMHIHCFASNI